MSLSKRLKALQGLWIESKKQGRGKTWLIDGDKALEQIPGGNLAKRYTLTTGDDGNVFWGLKATYALDSSFKSGDAIATWYKGDAAVFSWERLGPPPGRADKKAEKRIDPLDWKAYTLDEMLTFYSETYGTPKIETTSYWMDCKPASGGAKGKDKAEPEKKGKGKGKAEPEKRRQGKGEGKGKTLEPDPKAASAKKEVALSPGMMSEKRIDPVDGKAYTLGAMVAFYSETYGTAKIDTTSYWQACQLESGAATLKGKAKGKGKTETQSKPKSKGKGKGIRKDSGSQADAYPVVWDDGALSAAMTRTTNPMMDMMYPPMMDPSSMDASSYWMMGQEQWFHPGSMEAEAAMLEAQAAWLRQQAAQREIEEKCGTEGCKRTPWNGVSGDHCCKTCVESNGLEHGNACNKRFERETRVLINAGPDMDEVCLWKPGQDFTPWVERARDFLQKEGTAAIWQRSALPIPAETAEAVGVALDEAGFECSDSIYTHPGEGVTVKIPAAEVTVLHWLTITVDGIDAEDLTDWATMQIETDVKRFGSQLLKWVKASQGERTGLLEDEPDSPSLSPRRGLQFLPKPDFLAVRNDRQLLIYTWGKALQKAPPADSQFNFNAGVLNGRGTADLWLMNGLEDVVQSNILCCGLFPRWIGMVCSKIEKESLHTISINCTKGRHRSVAAAEILRKHYYPNATIQHLTIH